MSQTVSVGHVGGSILSHPRLRTAATAAATAATRTLGAILARCCSCGTHSVTHNVWIAGFVAGLRLRLCRWLHTEPSAPVPLPTLLPLRTHLVQ